MIATDPLSLLFIGCFLAGLAFLVLTALMGSIGHGGHAIHHDIAHHAVMHHASASHTHGGSHAHGSHGTHNTTHDANQHSNGNAFQLFAYLNPTSFVFFLLGFGFFGYVFHNLTALALPVPIILFLSTISGFVVVALLLMLLSRMFGDSEGATVQDVSDRTGMLGKVNLTIQANSMGEIIYVSPGGMRKSVPARSIDGRRLERDQEVVVVNYQHGVAEVDTWEHFVNQEESGHLAEPDADELATLRALLEEPNKIDTEYIIGKDLQKE